MGETTRIEWADSTWNPWIGCSKVSPGCLNCYAGRLVKRMGGDFSRVRKAGASFDAPLRWKKPRRIFVCSMSDFFIKDADPWREEAWRVMQVAPQHIYMILTKRPGLMAHWAKTHPWPAHIWAGTSVESAKYLPRLDVLARVPAKVRFVSCEPLLGPLAIKPYLYACGCSNKPCSCKGLAINWVIVGGESGPQARPMHPDWARGLRDQCAAAGVPFFMKQWGEWIDVSQAQGKYKSGVPFVVLRADGTERSVLDLDQWLRPPDGCTLMMRLGKSKTGALLDGREWKEAPVYRKT